MKRTTAVALIGALALSLAFAAPAHPWGSAAHTWFAERLGARGGGVNLQEMYGAVAPDQYNFIFEPVGVYLSLQTHEQPMQVVNAAWSCPTRALAFGFASHNEMFGADFTAHIAGRTTPGVGYIVSKGVQIAPDLVPPIALSLVQAGATPAQAQAYAAAIAPFFGHLLAEQAVDWLIKSRLEPSIGAKMMNAAKLRSPQAPALLAAAYAPGLASAFGMPPAQAGALIAGVEAQFRAAAFDYGRGFLASPGKTMDYLADQSVAVGQAYLKALTGFDAVITHDQAEAFIALAAGKVAPDYKAELAATLDYVAAQLEDRDIETCKPPGK